MSGGGSFPSSNPGLQVLCPRSSDVSDPSLQQHHKREVRKSEPEILWESSRVRLGSGLCDFGPSLNSRRPGKGSYRVCSGRENKTGV